MIIILVGPSCVGKTTIAEELLKKIPESKLTISCTTRDKRSNETEGDEYYFITEEEFKNKVINCEFIEWEKVHDKYYGTLFNEFNNKNVLAILDTKGAKAIKTKFPAAKTIFIMPPSLDILLERLKNRGIPDSEIKKRYQNAKLEIEEADNYDYLIINNILETSVEKIYNIYVSNKNESIQEGIT